MTGEGRFADLGTPATAVAPLIPDIVNGLGRPTNAVAFDVSYWDEATVDEFVAMQRKATFSACKSKSYRCWYGTSALPSEAEGRRASTMGQLETDFV